MALIRGNDSAYSGCSVAIETTYNSPVSPVLRIPLLGEGLVINRENFPKNREFGPGTSGGAQTALDSGRTTISGSIKCYPRYAQWFSWMLTHVMGGSEQVQAGVLPDATSPGGAFATHCYQPQTYRSRQAGSFSGVPPGMTLYAFKQTQTRGGGEVFSGCVPTKFTFEQPDGDRPFANFEFIGQLSEAVDLSSSAAVTALTAGQIPIKARNLQARGGNAPALCQIGQGSSTNHAFNIVSWKLVVDNGIEFAQSFMNTPDVLDKPGHARNFSVTGEIVMRLEANFAAGATPIDNTNMPAYDFVNKNANGLRFRYQSDSFIVGAIPYALDFYIKNVIYTKMEDGFTSAGVPTVTFGFEAQLATFTTGETALTANSVNMLLIQMVGSSTTYATAAQGGNTAMGGSYVAVGPQLANNTDGVDWTDPDNALTNASGEATSGLNADEIILTGFDFSDVPTDATAIGVQVRLDAWMETVGTGSPRLDVSVSWDGGSTWATDIPTDTLTDTEQMILLGDETEDWGHTWDPSTDFADFQVRITSAGSSGGSPDWHLDFVTATVLYIPAL